MATAAPPASGIATLLALRIGTVVMVPPRSESLVAGDRLRSDLYAVDARDPACRIESRRRGRRTVVVDPHLVAIGQHDPPDGPAARRRPVEPGRRTRDADLEPDGAPAE